MFSVEINYLAVLVCGIANMALGALWYSPVLFAKPWMKLVNLTEEEIQEGADPKMYLFSFIVSLLMAYILALFVAHFNLTSIGQGIVLALVVWAGFTLPPTLPGYLFESRPMKLYAINFGYPLISMIVMGIILTAWR